MFCDMCQQPTRFGLTQMTRNINIRGVDIPVLYRGEICARCGAERYDEQLESTLMQKAMDTYREKKKIISADRIQAYMKKNGLSHEEMAVRAGCAVNEILRAARGTLLDTATNEKLKKAIIA